MDRKLLVAGFLLCDGKALILKRSSELKFFPNNYNLPGGHVEAGEDPKDALVREFFEETGLKIKVLAPYHTYSYITDDKSKHYIEIGYFVELDDDIKNLKLNEEHDSFEWITADDLLKLQISPEEAGVVKAGFKVV